jgi:hypothetical protein
MVSRWVAAWAVMIVSVLCLGSVGYLPTARAAACSNDEFRFGPSAALPDCRAYELVTPAEANGRLIEPLNTFNLAVEKVLSSELVSPAGDSVAFLTFMSPLTEIRGATGVADVYEAGRTAGGWTTARRLTPSGFQMNLAIPGGVSPEHSYSVSTSDDTFSPLQIEGRPTVYLGNPDGSFELVGLGSLGSEPYPEVRYLSEGGEHIVFSTGSAVSPTGVEQSIWCFGNPHCKVTRLEPNAPPTGTGAVYDRSADGETHVVSLLPGGATPAAGEQAFYKGTSKDGTAVAFTIEGVLYIRIDNEETYEVAAGEPTYAGISDEARYVFYVAGGNINRFDTQTEADIQVNATGDGRIVNVSGDGSHVYFISESQIGGEGQAGQPNLYVWSGTAPEYIATVAASDLERTSGKLNGFPALTNWTTWVTNQPKNGFQQGPGNDSSRSTPDGSVLVLESKAQLTAYDNDGHTEIYRYDDTDKSLACVSCSRLAEPATDDARLQELRLINGPTIIHNVSDDGSRVFFESEEALVEGDTDGINDIYEWREGEGGGSGLGLISSGQSSEYPPPPEFPAAQIPAPNLLLAVTPDGDDVVFLSQDALVPEAPQGGAVQIYDARAGGGFQLSATREVCTEEACWPNPRISAPSLPNPASEATQSSGNVKPGSHKLRCRRAKRRKRRCARHRGRGSIRLEAAAARREEEQVAAWNGGVAEGSPDRAPSSSAASPMLSNGPYDGYGIKSVRAELSAYGAGLHANFTNEITLNHTINGSGEPVETARTEEAVIAVPPGLLGNLNAIPKCMTGELVALSCPINSQVGITKILVTWLSGELTEPLYNLAPPHPDSEVARLGFVGASYPVFIDVKVRTASDYGATATVYGASGFQSLVRAKTTLWGNPADPSHDKERLTPTEALSCSYPCKAPGGKRESELPPTAFMTNPSACQPMSVAFSARSYQLPGQLFSATAPMDPITGCTGLPFAPSFSAEPTSHVAGAPTGLKTTLHLPQQSSEAVNSPATATMREARVTLPEGMQIAAGAANWIGTCSDAQVGFHEEVDAQCPDASKLGEATIASPDLPQPIHGWLYQRAPSPGHQFGLWLVADDLGLHIKIPGELKPDPTTGRLTAVFSDLPQVPSEEIELNVWGGPRAPLENPAACGTYATDYTFTPHSNDPPVSGQSQMTIDQGCDQPFSPTLHAGVTDPVAGRFSPLVLDVAREDGEQPLRGFDLKLPDGELAKPKGVPLCPDTLAPSGACPFDSRIGTLTAAVGPGPDPLWVPQAARPPPAIYLAGPYQGSPFSTVSVAPAQAGPFDLGNVVVRSGLEVDRESGQAVVKADPLPQFFEGVGLTYRHLHVVVDRPEFALNPTDCREMAVTAEVHSTLGAVANPSSRFEVDGCRALKFKPRLSLQLSGGSERGDYPALKATLKARKGDANLGKVSVALPHSEFLAQEHIQTICTRKRFAADKCPKGSVYGRAKAWTPLLSKPLEGPVYLRSSDHPLPDLVLDLKGEIEIAVAGRIDSKHGGIRTSFEQVPDAPISRFVLRMKGGPKGLLVNSTDVCKGKHRATVRMRAQNGRRLGMRPVLESGGCAGKKH